MKETTLRITQTIVRLDDLPDRPIPPELVERMARAMERLIEASIMAVLRTTPAPPPRRACGIIVNPIS